MKRVKASKFSQGGGVLLSGVLAGAMISLGGAVFLSLENRIAGASLFSIGLFFVVSMRLWLYTGRIGYLLRNPPGYARDLLLALAGNFLGTLGMALLVRRTRAAAALVARADELAAVKMGDSLLSVFVLAVFCGMLMYLGVNGFAAFESQLGKHAAVFLVVVVFILSGYEHCVANMYYYSVAGVWGSGRAWTSMAAMVLGNSVGSIAVGELYQLSKRLQEK